MAGKDKDTVTLNYFLAQKWKPELARRTYERGINNLLEMEFLFRSVAADVYFVNIRYMFNGDRMVIMSVYHRAGSTLQTELPLEQTDLMINNANVQKNDESNNPEQEVNQ
jgi:hypothetical protein